MAGKDQDLDATEVATSLAASLGVRGQDFALGGAIALAFWSRPRGTIDVDITLFIAPDRPTECIRLLQDMGCELEASSANASLREHGFCSVHYLGLSLDVFLPLVPFYEQARARRKYVPMGNQQIPIWDAETLAVFKMMFFRTKDIADVEQMLQIQGTQLDHKWVRQQLEQIYGVRDPRVARWDELVAELQL
jgi:hypothetical protein